MVCGLVTMPGHYWPQKARRWGERELSRTALVAIGAGLGCDCPMGEDNPAVFERLRAASEKLATERRRITQVWGIRDRVGTRFD
jgi:hypothetical protein